MEHRAYLLLLAERAGARVPNVVAAGTAGDLGHALLVTDDEAGQPLSELDEHSLTDSILDDAWQNLSNLHRAHLAHGNLHLGAVVLRADGTTLIDDFSQTSSSASDERLALDGAEFLASTAAIVGVARAVDAMTRTLERDEVEQLLPLLQPTAMFATGAPRDSPRPRACSLSYAARPLRRSTCPSQHSLNFAGSPRPTSPWRRVPRSGSISSSVSSPV